MPSNEKEYNGYLFDQLTLLDRLEITESAHTHSLFSTVQELSVLMLL